MPKKRSRESLAPDITPLIDVVFLLLIFFMVSTVFKRDELALMMSLPTSKEGESQQEQMIKSIYIELTQKDVAYNGKKTTLKALGPSLSKLKKRTIPVELRIDKSVKYERVVELLDILKKSKLTNLELITEQ